EPAARRLRRSGRAARTILAREADPPRARRTRTCRGAEALFLEEREVDQADHIHGRGQTRLLGSARLPHARRSLDGGALWLRAPPTTFPSPPSTARRCRSRPSEASRCCW